MYSRKKTQGKDQGRTNVDGKEGKGKAFMAQVSHTVTHSPAHCDSVIVSLIIITILLL